MTASKPAVLYRPELFETVTDEVWDADRVRDAIGAIVADVDGACRGPRRLWRADWAARSLGMTSPGTNLYAGAAGTVFALEALRTLGLAETRLDLTEVAACALEAP